MATQQIQRFGNATIRAARQPGSGTLDVHIVRLATVLSGAAAFLIVASVVQDLGQARFFSATTPDKIWLLDIDSEESIFNWLSSVALFADALLLFLVASERQLLHLPHATYWYVLAIGFVGLSFDETASLHEKLSGTLHRTLHTSGAFAFAWVIPASIFCALLLLFYIPFLRALPARVAGALLLSGLLYVGGAVGTEMIAGAIYERLPLDSLPYRMVTSVEETLEISGALLLAFVLGRNLATLTGATQSALRPLPGAKRPVVRIERGYREARGGKESAMPRSEESNQGARADKAVLLALTLLTLIYVACVLILDGDVILPLS